MDFPLIRDESKCIKCMRCIQICDKVQSLKVWDIAKTGSRTTGNVSLWQEHIQKKPTVHFADSASPQFRPVVLPCPAETIKRPAFSPERYVKYPQKNYSQFR
ncbi:MAG: hypothetical protein ACLRYY_11475 [Anaerobutyricum soehngenii]